MAQQNHKVWVMTLTSGIQIIGEYHEGDDNAIYLRSPFEMSLNFDMEGRSKLYVSRYLPYAIDYTVAVMRNNVEAMVVASDVYAAFYWNKVKQFNALLSPEATDDESEYRDTAFENPDGEQEDISESLATHRNDSSTKH